MHVTVCVCVCVWERAADGGKLNSYRQTKKVGNLDRCMLKSTNLVF